jgi:N-methylhydantoinase B/oxoprolinase/acetone carboxylase alpha subunit
VTANDFLERELREKLAAGRYPARNPDQNVADLRAQLAANARGIAGIERAVQRHGLETVQAYMRHVQDNAAACMKEAIDTLRPGSFRYEMDSGQAIVVRVAIDRAARRVHVDFTGASAQDPHNFNASRAVCMAAVAAGNVETSRCIVDALYGALGMLAASQGTMNNLTFGNDRCSTTRPLPGARGRDRRSRVATLFKHT